MPLLTPFPLIEILELLQNKLRPGSVSEVSSGSCSLLLQAAHGGACGEGDEGDRTLEVTLVSLGSSFLLWPAQWLMPLRALERQPSVQVSG